jgi:integrase
MAKQEKKSDGLFLRGKVWWYRFTIDGETYRSSTKATDRKIAERVKHKVYNEIVEGLYFKKKKSITFGDASLRYYEEVAQHQPSGAQADANLTRMALFFGENTPLSEITGDELTRYVKQRREKVSNDTVNLDLMLLCRVWRRAALIWGRDIGTMPNWSALKLPTKAARVRWLTDEEEKRLFAALQEKRPDFLPLVKFGLMCGQRKSNLIGLRWEHVMEEDIIFRNVKSRKPGGETHILPMSPEMRELIESQRGKHPEYVFTHIQRRPRPGKPAGTLQPICRESLRSTWNIVMKAAGISDFRPHDMRHTVATRLYEETGDVKLVQDVLGHADIEMTLRYTHQKKPNVRAALMRLTAKKGVTAEAASGTNLAHPTLEEPVTA